MTSQLPKTANPSLYDRDYYLWLEQTAAQIRQRDVKNLDWKNLLEEIESMGKSEKNALESNLTILLMHNGSTRKISVQIVGLLPSPNTTLQSKKLLNTLRVSNAILKKFSQNVMQMSEN